MSQGEAGRRGRPASLVALSACTQLSGAPFYDDAFTSSPIGESSALGLPPSAPPSRPSWQAEIFPSTSKWQRFEKPFQIEPP